MYALYAPIQATYKKSQSLKGFAKMKFDKKHKDSLSNYPELKGRMQSLLQNGEKITLKQWKAEPDLSKQSLSQLQLNRQHSVRAYRKSEKLYI